MRKFDILFAALVAAVSAGASPLTVAVGWDTGGVTPAQLLAHADQFADLPYDGVVFKLLTDTADRNDPTCRRPLADTKVWSREEMARRFGEDCRKIVRCKGLQKSFLSMYFSPHMPFNWKKDEDWRCFAANLRSMAWFAKTYGLQGLVLDSEDYLRVFPYELKPRDGMDYDEACKIARRRGAELFRGVFEEYPDIQILTYWWLTFRAAYGSAADAPAFARGLGDLLPAFTDGILDVMPLTARFYDGNEHTYHSVFASSAIAQRINHQALISPENRAKFRACFGVGGAFYLDMYTNPPGGWYKPPVAGRRLNAFLDRYEDAQNASEIIWIYGEKHSHVNWTGYKPAKGYEAAFTNGTWDAALPGYVKELKILRNPKDELMPRLRELKQKGLARNVAGEPQTKDDGLTYKVEVTGTRHGEWYAIAVEMKSTHPEASVVLHKGKWAIWNRGTNPVVFSEPDANGVRRGVSFQRIWGEADNFVVNCGYNDYYPTKPQDLKVRVYKVFDPNAAE